MSDRGGALRETDRPRVIISLKPDAAIPPDLLVTDRWEKVAPFERLRSLRPDLIVRRYFTSVDEWAVPNPAGPPTPLPGSEKGARYFYVEPAAGVDLDPLLHQLRGIDAVEWVFEERLAPEPPETAQPHDDLLSDQQVYLQPAPLGIDALHAFSLGVTGQGASLVDVEQGWFLQHVELVARRIRAPLSGENLLFKDHGTAVLGQLIGSDDTVGIIGIAPNARARVVSEWRDEITRKTADALVFAVSKMERGDVLLVEAQAKAADETRLPVEVDDLSFLAIQFATRDRAVIVVEPAGNGGINLDTFTQPPHGEILNRASSAFRDSGAIMVGAATLGSRSRWPHSAFGSRVDCFALGEKITTAQGIDDFTHTFDGTSGASAIVAGAALLVQSWRKKRGLDPLDPSHMRDLLRSEVNTPCGDGSPIGRMPNLRALLTE